MVRLRLSRLRPGHLFLCLSNRIALHLCLSLYHSLFILITLSFFLSFFLAHYHSLCLLATLSFSFSFSLSPHTSLFLIFLTLFFYSSLLLLIRISSSSSFSLSHHPFLFPLILLYFSSYLDLSPHSHYFSLSLPLLLLIHIFFSLFPSFSNYHSFDLLVFITLSP